MNSHARVLESTGASVNVHIQHPESMIFMLPRGFFRPFSEGNYMSDLTRSYLVMRHLPQTVHILPFT